MTSSRTTKAIALLATLACAAVLGSIAAGYTGDTSHSQLGAGWRCSKLVFMTTCTRVSHVAPGLHLLGTDPAALRRA